VIGAHDGIGLQNMRDRIGAVGGRVEILSEPDRGTLIAAAVPLTEASTRGATRSAPTASQSSALPDLGRAEPHRGWHLSRQPSRRVLHGKPQAPAQATHRRSQPAHAILLRPVRGVPRLGTHASSSRRRVLTRFCVPGRSAALNSGPATRLPDSHTTSSRHGPDACRFGLTGHSAWNGPEKRRSVAVALLLVHNAKTCYPIS
jgi:hypothetical protein